MKKLLSSLLVFTMCLSQVSLVGHSQENYGKEGEKPVNKGSLNSFNVESDKEPKYSKDKSKKDKDAEKSQNIDIVAPTVMLCGTVLASTAIHEYAESKKPNGFEQFYSATGKAIKNVWRDAKGSAAEICYDSKKWIAEKYPIAKAWLSETYDYSKNEVLQGYSILGDFIKERYFDVKNGMSKGYNSVKDKVAENYVALKIWLNKSKENA